MKRTVRILCLALVIGLGGSLPFGSNPVVAHEHVTVGEYELTVGWRDEPPVAGSKNGLALGIEHHFPNGTTVWVVGAENDLTAELSTGTSSVRKDLAPQFGLPGWYTFDVIPTRPGSYAVRLNGTLGSTSVDVTVSLEDVRPASELAFPVADPTESELNARLDAVQSQLTLALALAGIGLVVGGVGLAAGWRMSRSRGKTQ
ncbi:MAG: hypothetical protein ACREDF_12120 [Thermoplasmata archaeon]